MSLKGEKLMSRSAQSMRKKFQTSGKRKEYMDLYHFVATFYHHLLCNTAEGEQAMKYLLSRGFTKEIIEKFQIGWSHQSDVLRKLLLAHGYELDDHQEFGILQPDRRRNGMRTGFFHNRITLPIRNLHGEIVAFSARTLPGNTHPAKYLNTPDTPFFEKGKILYNLDLAVSSIKRKGFAVLFEGFFDTITATQNGLDNVISVMGTSLTEQQIEEIHEWTDRVVICYDGDAAGMESAKRIGEAVLEQGLDIRVSIMPEGIDPHDYITEYGIDRFKKIIAKSSTYIEFCKEHAKRKTDFSKETDKLKYANKVLSELHKADSLGDTSRLYNELAKELGISTEVIKGSISRNNII